MTDDSGAREVPPVAAASSVLPVAGGAETWRWLRGRLARQWPAVTFTLAAGLVGAAAAVVPVYALGVLVDRVEDGGGGEGIVGVATVIVAAAVVAGLARGGSGYLVARLGSRLVADLRERTVERAVTLPPTIVERAGKGELVARVGADVAAVDRAVSEVIPQMLSALLLGMLSVAAMAGIDWRLGIAGTVSVPLYVVALRWYLPRSGPLYAAERRAIAERSALLVESMHGLPTLHAYGWAPRFAERVDVTSASARDISIDVFGLFTRFVGRVHRAEFTGLAAIMVAGFWLVETGSLTVGQTVAATVLFHQLFNPLSMLLYSFDSVQSAGAALARLVGVVSIPDEPTHPTDPARRPPVGRPDGATLELRQVSFAYPAVDGEPEVEVLHDLSLTVLEGERVALVGSSGAGKTTAALLLAGIHAPSRGAVLTGGIPVTWLDPAALRRQVAVVSQDTHVFAGPLIEDLRLARPWASREDVDGALLTVGADSWVRNLPDGVDTVVGEGGHALTAAQAQQVALARLVLADPAVAILDEATAEAGSLGARELEASAAAATEGRTTLVIAHRLTQAASADRVVVLEAGRVSESGTHAELVAGGGRYAELWRAWESRPALVSTASFAEKKG